jgi:hypothetical protein
MKLRSLALSLGVTTLLVPAMLLAPAAVLAADTAPATAAAPTTAAVPAKTKVKANARCDRVYSTMIQPSAKNGCKGPKPFRTYTPEDIERTGELDINDALRKVDTIFW